MKKFFCIIAALALFGFMACGDNGNDVVGEGPVIITVTLPGGTMGEPYSETLEATGDAPIAWSVSVGSLPAGLGLNSATGVISGIPTAAGSTTFTIRAANAVDIYSREFTIVVIDPTLSITTTSLPAGTLGAAYNETLEASGAQPITWALYGGTALPAGLTLSATGVISGTPTAEGSTTFTVRAENDHDYDTQELTIQVIDLSPSITTTSLPNGRVGEAYNQTLEASGAGPITWTLYGGTTLPAGLNLSATGVISGEPTAMGSTTFTVRAQNIHGYDTQELTIVVVSVPLFAWNSATDPITDTRAPTDWEATTLTSGVTQVFGPGAGGTGNMHRVAGSPYYFRARHAIEVTAGGALRLGSSGGEGGLVIGGTGSLVAPHPGHNEANSTTLADLHIPGQFDFSGDDTFRLIIYHQNTDPGFHLRVFLNRNNQWANGGTVLGPWLAHELANFNSADLFSGYETQADTHGRPGNSTAGTTPGRLVITFTPDIRFNAGQSSLSQAFIMLHFVQGAHRMTITGITLERVED